MQIYIYKWNENSIRSVKVAGASLQDTIFQSIPFHLRRDLTPQASHPGRYSFILNNHIMVAYWSVNCFTFFDETGHPFRTDHWLKPLDQFIRTFTGQDIEDLSIIPEGMSPYNWLYFPSEHPAALKLAAHTDDKIQFFKKAYKVSSIRDISKLLNQPTFAGDMLFVEANPKVNEFLLSDLSMNDKINLDYKLLHFSANRLELKINNPFPEPVWLFYSDVWDPLWKASINDQSTDVYKADIAYKALEIPPGEQHLRIFTESRRFDTLIIIWGIISFIILLGVLSMVGKMER